MQRRKEPSVQMTVKFSQSERETLEKFAAKTNRDMSTLIRQYVRKGLKTDGFKHDEDALNEMVARAVKGVIEPSVERLAAMNAKTGIIASSGFFLTVLLLEQLGPQFDINSLTVKARKLGITYIKGKDDSIDKLIESSLQSIFREAEL